MKKTHAPIYMTHLRFGTKLKKKETKSNAQVAREFEFSFPCELNAQQRQRMLDMFCGWLVKNHGVVAQGCIHAPHGKNADKRNYHAHVMFSTRRFENGQFTEKTREFSKRPYDEKELKSTSKRAVKIIQSDCLIVKMRLNYSEKFMRRSVISF